MNNNDTNTENLAKYIDHTNLNPAASQEVIVKLCNEALEYGFRSVCINPNYIELANKLLKDTDVLVCTVVGFPLGQNTTLTKIFETVDAINKGADEIDMVINIADLKSRQDAKIINEVNRVVMASGNRTVKVIVETCLLSYEDKMYAVEIISKTKAAYIKTSTGFSNSGADIEDIKMWKKWIKAHFSPLLIKAAGGIRNNQELIDFIAAGSSRIGTSKGIELLNEKQEERSMKNDTDKKVLNFDLNFKDIDVVPSPKDDKPEKKATNKNEIPVVKNLKKGNSVEKKTVTSDLVENPPFASKKNVKKNKNEDFNKMNLKKQDNAY